MSEHEGKETDCESILYENLIKRYNLKIAPTLKEFKKRFPYSELVLDPDTFPYFICDILLSEVSGFKSDLYTYITQELQNLPGKVKERLDKKFSKEKMEKIYLKCVLEEYRLRESEAKARRDANPNHLTSAINSSYELIVKEIFPLAETICSETRAELENETNVKATFL